MEVLWSSDRPCTLRKVRIRTAERFPARRGRTPSAVQSILENLAARGYVEKIGRAPGRPNGYRPRISRDEALAGAAETVVDEFCGFDRRDGWYLVRAFLAGVDLEEVPFERSGGRCAAERSERGWDGTRVASRAERGSCESFEEAAERRSESRR